MKRCTVLFLFLGCILIATLPALAAGPYVDNGDGTVADESTGLMWQQADDGVERDWSSACQYCEDLQAAGYDDWRAPRIDELKTIVDYTQYDPAINSVFSNSILSDSLWYWSSSTSWYNPTGGDDHTVHAFQVGFYNGNVRSEYKTDTRYVRCVRSGPYWSFDSLNYLVIKNNDVVEDIHTGLEWQRQDDGVDRDRSSACEYCKDLVLDGHDDWRIPELYELSSIVDYSNSNPSISTEVFSSRPADYWYWSGSRGGRDNGNLPWLVHFKYGFVNFYYDKYNYDLYVRCVRSGPYRSFDPLNPLIISLAASETSDPAPFTVDFRGLVGWGKPEYSYFWNFGDGATSTNVTHPIHLLQKGHIMWN